MIPEGFKSRAKRFTGVYVARVGRLIGEAGIVTTFRPSVGGVDDVVTATCTTEVDATPVVKIAAA